MGGMSAMNSIDRVLKAHGDEIISNLTDHIPQAFRDTINGVTLSNNTYAIEVEWTLTDGHTLPGPSIDIDTLAETYPDCEVGY